MVKDKVKDIIIKEYGSINAFLDAMTLKNHGKLPRSRAYLYKLINHQINNPGIKTLNQLSSLTGVKKSNIYAEYSE